MNNRIKQKQLIQIALVDLWKTNAVEPLEPRIIDEALSLWTTEELIEFLDRSSKEISSEFTIVLDRSGCWRVTHLGHEEKSKKLENALFAMLEHHLTEDKIAKDYLAGFEKKYLDFYSPDYGEEPEEEEDD